VTFIRPVAGFEEGGAEESHFYDFASNAVDLYPVADPDAILTHQHEPAEEPQDEVLQDHCEAGCGEANDGRQLARGSKHNQQDKQEGDDLYTKREEDAPGIHAAPVDSGAPYEIPHENVEEDHAKENKRNQRKRLR